MSDLSRILELTREVETLVADGEWAAAAAREEQRRGLLIRYVEANPDRPEGLREIYERNCQTLEIARCRRDALVAESKAFLSNVRGLKAYSAQASRRRSYR